MEFKTADDGLIFKNKKKKKKIKTILWLREKHACINKDFLMPIVQKKKLWHLVNNSSAEAVGGFSILIFFCHILSMENALK